MDKAAVKTTIYEHPEFAAFIAGMSKHFTDWRTKTAATLKAVKADCHPKDVIGDLSESLLAHYASKALIDPYDIYQHLMDYWAETMQDDVYLVAADGWKAETTRILEKDKKGKERDKGWTCDLIPKALIVAALDAEVHGEMDRVSQALAQRVKELAERYEVALPQMVERATDLRFKVTQHLERMGFAWR